jgi:hypothetical protein
MLPKTKDHPWKRRMLLLLLPLLDLWQDTTSTTDDDDDDNSMHRPITVASVDGMKWRKRSIVLETIRYASQPKYMLVKITENSPNCFFRS